MARILRNRQWLDDDCTHVADDAPVPLHGPVIVSLARWIAERASLLDRTGPVGIVLETTDEPGLIADDLPNLSLVCVHFRRFNDGRGYTVARLLRERHGYRGELRAIGDVLRDQLFVLSRVGFDAFALRADQDEIESVRAFDDFSEAYQTSVERPQPLFRRRGLADA